MKPRFLTSTLLLFLIKKPNPEIVASSPIPSKVIFIIEPAALPLICKPSDEEPNESISDALTLPINLNATGVVSYPF